MAVRHLYHQLVAHLDKPETTVITGPRQSGKTTLLNQLAGFLRERGDNVVVLTLEDHSILSRFNQHPENLFDFIIRDEARKSYVLIDEIQYLRDPSNFIKLLYDKHSEALKLVVTGSSAFYLDGSFKDSLAGRKRIFELYTLDFNEFLDFRTGNGELSAELENMRNNPRYQPPAVHELRSLFQEYLAFGGYPAVVLAPDEAEKILKLKDLLQSFVRRDILESGIDDTDRFYQLMLLLSHQTGALLNIHELSRTLRVSGAIIERYLHVLRKCYHIGLIRPFHANIRKELTKMPKPYFHDLGMRNVLLNQFLPIPHRVDRGELVESYAYIRLRNLYDPDGINFWRTSDGNEIDFVIKRTETSGLAYEIKYDDALFDIRKYRAFQSGSSGYPVQVRSLIVSDPENEILRL